MTRVHSFPAEKPKLNQEVKQILLQGRLERCCVLYPAGERDQGNSDITVHTVKSGLEARTFTSHRIFQAGLLGLFFIYKPSFAAFTK